MQGWAPSRELLAEVQANPSGSAIWVLCFFVDLVKDGETGAFKSHIFMAAKSFFKYSLIIFDKIKGILRREVTSLQGLGVLGRLGRRWRLGRHRRVNSSCPAAKADFGCESRINTTVEFRRRQEVEEDKLGPGLKIAPI